MHSGIRIPEGYISVNIPTPPMPLGFNMHKKQFVVNEVLCFVQNKTDSEFRESIVNLGSCFYKYEDIKYAKNLLYNTVPVEKRKLITHRGKHKSYQE